jgi:alkylation response protein AidB-like acyl-CoA dehydrogenase
VVDGHVADALIVAAQADGGVALLLVPAGAPGLTVQRTVMVDAHNAARVSLDGVRVGADALIGSVGAGPRAAGRRARRGPRRAVVRTGGPGRRGLRAHGRLPAAARQFGRMIGEFQALQHRAAELFCDLELARALVRQAQAALDAGAPDAAEGGTGQGRACLSANRAVQEGVQMHGGIGMTDDFDIGLFMKRARVLQELLGDAGFHMDRAARMSGY